TRGQPATALVFAITASLSSLLAAWTVQRLTPREGGVGLVAALLAGAPPIHLVFRGLPPNIRKDRFREEYPELYQALAQVPGVHFVSNSRKAAEA
ncbi:hypothetical protein, partial [Listeria seeligeri]|uniref:hypothetical protein n=1 Tax=Listeria seeligeri TaxID=1640 RepID=UPI0022EA2864